MEKLASGKRIIIVVGYCHATWLANYMQRETNLPDYFDIYHYSLNPGGPRHGITEEITRRCDCLIQQVQRPPNPEFPFESCLPSSVKKIVFPTMRMQFLFPLYILDPRNQPEKGYPLGKFPYGDRLALTIMNQTRDAEEALRQYRESDIKRVVDIDSLYEVACREIDYLDSLCDIKVKNYIIDNFRYRQLFSNVTHPLDGLVIEVLKEMITRIRIDFDLPEIEIPEPVGYRNWGMEVPLHPGVIEHFNLEWASPDTIYTYQDWRLTFDEYISKYIRFEGCFNVPREERALDFPSSLIGSVKVRPMGSVSLDDWKFLTEARGKVIVPSDQECMLSLNGGESTDYSMLKRFKGNDFKTLEIIDPEFDDEALRQLTHLDNLHMLQLTNTGIGDGASDVLKGMWRLQRIYAPSSWSRRLCRKFRAALPNCEIIQW